jgi:cytochrome c-type biogenesis protein CcmH
MLAGIVVFTVALSAGLYNHLGDPNLPSGRGGGDTLPELGAVIDSLRERLRENPDDVNGWKMLARSSMTMQQFDTAVSAYEKAMELEDGRNAQTMVDLALALLSRDRTPIEGRPAGLFDSALAIEPNNPAALFYAGAAAAERGDTELAVSRWEILLGLNPPPEIQAILEQRIAEWRGEVVPQPEPSVAGELPPDHPAVTDAAAAAPATADPDAVVTARLALSADAMNAISADANVFLIARDPAQPSPPIAVSRLRLSELPKVVSMGDAQSMVQGRALSGFEEFELLARVSLSGSPAATSGDWFGSLIVRPADNNTVLLSIDRQVP